MARTPAEITDAEMGIVNLLWQRGSMSVRDLAGCLYRSATPAQYATVSKQLARLQRKNVVRQNRQTWPYEFEATSDRDYWIGRRIQATADKLCGGSLAPLLSCLLQGRLDRNQISDLRNWLDKLTRKTE